ncbi:hypothetical protein SCA6_006091 [Theobroma cacao]
MPYIFGDSDQPRRQENSMHNYDEFSSFYNLALSNILGSLDGSNEELCHLVLQLVLLKEEISAS